MRTARLIAAFPLLLILATQCAPTQNARAQGRTPTPVRQERGNLVLEGIPAPDAALAERLERYLHTRQAWRVVQKIAHEGRSVGIIETASGQDVPATDLEALAQRYVAM